MYLWRDWPTPLIFHKIWVGFCDFLLIFGEFWVILGQNHSGMYFERNEDVLREMKIIEMKSGNKQVG